MTTQRPGRRLRTTIGALLLAGLATVGIAVPASASTSAHHRGHDLGTTSVTTAPGIAGTLIGAGILPLPVRGTSFRLGYDHGLTATYGFPITASTANLSGPSGDIRHSGGIDFVSRHGYLEIGGFDIDLAAGKIFTAKVDFAPGRIPALDVDLSGLKVTTTRWSTRLSGIVLRLDPAAAGALNSTFHLALPTNGSLVFGSAVITLNK
jgi:hypothetical protein